jgi:hypothetical protein
MKCLKKSRVRPIDLPPDSPDLASSEFHLLGNLKGALAGQEFDFTEQFLLAIREVTGSIGRAGPESVFDAWERRLSECVQMKGEYIT